MTGTQISPQEGDPKQERRWLRFGVTLWCLAAIAAYIRLYIGINFTDEAFYSALPYSFALGFKPYQEELNVTQNAGILLSPFFWIFLKVTGSPTGLILFNRHLYFALLLLGSNLARRVGTSWVDAGFGWLLGAFVLTFSHFNIPALSYNTLGALLFFIGLFQVLRDRPAGKPPSGTPGGIFGANLCLTLAAFCYPPLLPAAVAAFAATLWIAWREGRTSRHAWLGSAAFSAVVAGGFLWLATPDGIRRSLEYVASYNFTPEGYSPRAVILGQIRVLIPCFAGVTLWLVSPFVAVKRLPALAAFTACIAGAAALYLMKWQSVLSHLPSGSVPVVIGLALLLPAGLWLMEDRSSARMLLVLFGLPVLLAVPAVSLSSTNAFFSSPLGFFPAAVCLLLVAAVIAQRTNQRGPQGWGRLAITRLSFAPLLAYQCWSLLVVSFNDAPFSAPGGAVFASGAYAGLLSTPDKAEKWKTLTQDFNALNKPGGTLFVYEDFPAGFLLSTLRPRTFSTWAFWPVAATNRTRLMNRVFSNSPPDVVLQIGKGPQWVNDELEHLGYRPHLARPEKQYRILFKEPVR